MAEAVERNLENSLSEILYIKKTKLFSKSEISEVVRKRRSHEYSLQKRNKRVLDFDSYISTELTILKLLRFRRQISQETRYVDKIEKSIISRLARLHRQLCFRFQSRIDLWIRYIKFCKTLGRHLSVSRVWNRMLQVHGRTDPKLWAAAAAYHLYDNTKSKAGQNFRNLTSHRDELLSQNVKLKKEYELLNRYSSKADMSKLSEVLSELRENSDELAQAATDLDRERRLCWDKAHLNGIREARRLLTEGISLNPECDFLHLELIKLEISALDFFRNRVLPRRKNMYISESNSKLTAEVMDKEEANRARHLKRQAMENEEFMSFVTEDIDSIISGNCIKIIIESVLKRWECNQAMLESLNQIVSKVPYLIEEEIVMAINESLANCKKRQKLHEPMEVKDQDPGTSKENQIKMQLEQQIAELNRTVMNKGIFSAFELWDSWYSGSSNVEFRLVDPTLTEAIGLLRARLELHSTLKVYHSANQTDVAKYKETRHKMGVLVEKTRTFLDSLSTSQWGTKCPEFWVLYMDFERNSGDLTRIPAIQWRAQKIIDPALFGQLTSLLNKS